MYAIKTHGEWGLAGHYHYQVPAALIPKKEPPGPTAGLDTSEKEHNLLLFSKMEK